jgi:hypothetical protein
VGSELRPHAPCVGLEQNPGRLRIAAPT